MRIAFYAPLKAPGHPVPSGDRQMARAILAALTAAGHEVVLASDLRSFLRDPGDAAGLVRIEAAAMAERDRLRGLWQDGGLPDVFLCYHPYYKAPDLIGPPLCATFGLPYVTVETSYSARRNLGLWAGTQARVRDGIAAAAVNICLTARDAAGIAEAVPGAALARLRPFLAAPMPETAAVAEPGHLVTVAMMRPGDKMESYRRLAAALRLLDADWRLTVAGDGEMRAEVAALFASFGGRVLLAGRLEAAAVAALLARGAAYLWPGYGEAYGLAYLEAQAAGVPVVACRIAGVPEVVTDGAGGLLVEPGDDAAFAAGVARLLREPAFRAAQAQAARARFARDHALAAAAARLDAVLRGAVGR